MTRRLLVLVVGVALAFPIAAAAQTLESGQIRGVVYDQTKAALPGATVTLTSEATGFTQTVVTNEAGVYQFAQIPRGTYQMLVELSGFAPAKVTSLVVNVGASLTLDITMKLGTQAETVEVVGAAAAIDTSTSGVSQLINEESIASLPLAGRDYRDLAQLSSSAQVVPGLRGGIRLGGQQSDYTGLAIDGGDARDNFFGEFFGSLETKNSTIPLEAVQEFQVVTNGFAPEFGRSSGGLLNVVTKSGTNTSRGSGHYFFRGSGLTTDDALGTPPNIDAQHQFGASIGGPIQKDRQFYFVAFDVQRQHGPLVTKFAQNVSGVGIPEYGIADMASLEGSSEQFQNLFSILGRWDLQAANQRFSVRTFWTQNHTNGFTGGRGQNQIQASFDNTENFKNQGHNTVFTWNSAWGAAFNELKVMYSYQIRPRSPNGTDPEIQIDGVGNVGNRFFLPINGDNEKIQIQDNFQYAFGKHDMKFGGDINAYALLKNQFIGWSRGAYWFDSLASFQARQPYAFVQGFGLNGVPYPEAGSYNPRQRQTGVGLYVQDKWQVTPRFTVTYGLRWDGTWNPPAISGTPGSQVYAGVGGGSTLIPPPQETPDDFKQFGPRVGASYAFNLGGRPAVLRGAWGLYYAQTPTIFMPTGSGRTAVVFCFFNPSCVPPAGFPTLWPDPLVSGGPVEAALGPPGITYVDPDFRNPRVSNTTATLEWSFADNWTATATYAYSHSDFLRTGGFSSTNWDRNLVPLRVDEFGRTIVKPSPIFGPDRVDPTIGSATALGSFSRGNFHQIALNLTRRFADRYQLFVNYSWSKSEDNAASERDTDTYFGPQDPFDIELDYGRNALDIPHQFKFAGVAELPAGVMLSGLIIARSGVPFPAYAVGDVNGDGVTNNGHSNDRPTVNTGGSSFLLERYPARQPKFFQLDMRVSKTFDFADNRSVEVLVEFFNLFNTENLYSNPDLASTVPATLTSVPKPGDSTTGGLPYRDLNQISPGSTPFAAQLGVRLRF